MSVRVHHTITFVSPDLSESDASSLRSQLLRLRLIKPADSLLRFQIYEEHAAWAEVAALQRRYPTIDVCSTVFAPEELAAAPWVEVRPEWHHGYPMPDDDFGYLETTYALTEFCRACGAGAVQRAPFRLRGEPKWGRRAILQLNWVLDEFFVRPDLYDAVFKPVGVRARPVLHHKSGAPLATILQLDASADEVDLLLPSGTGRACAGCGRFKYLPLGRVVPLIREGPSASQLCRSRQMFGSGASAHRLVIMSGALYSRFAGSGTRGASFGVVSFA